MIGVVLPSMALDYAELSPLFFWKKTVRTVWDVFSNGARKSDEAVLKVSIFEFLAVIDLCLDLERESEDSRHSSSCRV